MKKLTFTLALLLLLSGCAQTAGPPPSPTPSQSMGSTKEAPSPTQEMPGATPENTWWMGKTAADLPHEVEPIGNISSIDGPVCLALLSEQDIGMYGDGDPKGGILLRKGEHLQFFPQTYTTARYTLPELAWRDFDGDEKNELVVKYLVHDTEGDIIYELHVYEWDGKEWSDHPFATADYQALLDEVIRYQYKDGSVHLVAGGSSCRSDYSGESAPVGLAPVGDLVFFREDPYRYSVIFGLRLALPDGKEQDIATLTASLTYDGVGFSLKEYSLESIGGV